MKRKILIIGLSAAAIIILAVALILALQYTSGNSYTALLEDGEKYLSTGDYVNAVITLQKAIMESPNEPDAYITLARTYMAMQKEDMAISILQKGYERTRNATIARLMIERNIPNTESTTQNEEQIAEIPTGEEKDTKPMLNGEMLTFFSASSFEDYRQKYSDISCTMEGNTCVIKVPEMEAELRYFDTDSVRVIDTAASLPYKEFVPNEVSIENIAFLFGGAGTVTFEELRSMDGISELQKLDGAIQFKAGGCTVTITCDADSVIHSDAQNLIIPSGYNTGFGQFEIKGKVFDVATGSYVTDAELKFYKGNDPYGEPTSVKTDGYGAYTVWMKDSGSYCVEITKTGYIKEQFTFYVSGGANEVNKDFSISCTMGADQIRFVLTWGSSPTDLDSYLVGNTSSGRYINTNFTNMKETNSSGEMLAQLDIDDTNGYGPETTTLYAIDGSYEFYVKDYTESGTMSYSGAQVKIYKGDALVHVVDICGGVGNYWSVCKINHGEITITNRPK